jgi:cell fate regulator YaaT (PSP1 superfamily)
METQNLNIKDEDILMSRGCCASSKILDKSKTGANSCPKLDTREWLDGIPKPSGGNSWRYVEVRFKNSHKAFFKLPEEMELNKGDIVAVEASPGHDIGIVSLTGETCRLQMEKKNVDPESDFVKKIYRRARLNDIEKWLKAVEKEDKTMVKTRQLARDLGLVMKVNDVEYQGDGTKAIFYYTAEERVDFRQLIKVLAENFRVRIEMKQIGVRQEAARVGGIGSCGRELCCSTWMTDFKSVTTQVARTQQLSLNPQKLAGQCGKLKCCLNFEQDAYLDEMESFPDTSVPLMTRKGEATYQKMDVFKKLMWYSYMDDPGIFHAIPVKKVKYILGQNKKGRKPENLEKFVQNIDETDKHDEKRDKIAQWNVEHGQ